MRIIDILREFVARFPEEPADNDLASLLAITQNEAIPALERAEEEIARLKAELERQNIAGWNAIGQAVHVEAQMHRHDLQRLSDEVQAKFQERLAALAERIEAYSSTEKNP